MDKLEEVTVFLNLYFFQCTKTCDGGTQRRSVKCLEYNEQENALKDSNKCRYSIREPIYRSCNTHKCEGNSNKWYKE